MPWRRRKREKLLFIDTNILLDFYRARTDAGIALLSRIDPLREKLITTYQVEMEFKKNRQKVILESLIALKAPESAISAPAFLAEAKTVEMMRRRIQDAKKRVAKLKDRIKRILEKPFLYDPVYKVAQRMFAAETQCALRVLSDEVDSIRRHAWRRFILGYPPRKKDDNSTGDAINWE
jgi:predicted nucleic acid-binding protein